jgi:hypothetical protein
MLIAGSKRLRITNSPLLSSNESIEIIEAAQDWFSNLSPSVVQSVQNSFYTHGEVACDGGSFQRVALGSDIGSRLGVVAYMLL